MNNGQIIGIHSYTWGEIKESIKKITIGARTRVMLSTDPQLIDHRFASVGPIEDLYVRYTFSEKRDVPLGAYEGRGSYLMQKDRIAKACTNDLLKENGIKELDFIQYRCQSIKGPDRIPENDNDFFFSFEIVKA